MSDTWSGPVPGISREGSGRRSLPVPQFREKLDYLLARTGRQNQWLTEVLVSPHGGRPSAQSVSNWKDKAKIPYDYLVSFRFAFGIDEATLALPDFEAFKAAADAVMMPGAGRYWKTLLEKAEQGPNALSLIVDGAPEPRRRLGNLGYDRPTPARSPLVPTAAFDDGVRFAVPASRLAGLVSGTGQVSLVLVCEDKLGWKTITPNRHHPGFEAAGERWLLPGPDRRPLYFHEAVGNYRAVLIAVAAALPLAIDESLRADKTVWGTDALAAWLFDTQPDYLIMDRPFLVTAPQR